MHRLSIVVVALLLLVARAPDVLAQNLRTATASPVTLSASAAETNQLLWGAYMKFVSVVYWISDRAPSKRKPVEMIIDYHVDLFEMKRSYDAKGAYAGWGFRINPMRLLAMTDDELVFVALHIECYEQAHLLDEHRPALENQPSARRVVETCVALHYTNPYVFIDRYRDYYAVELHNAGYDQWSDEKLLDEFCRALQIPREIMHVPET